jgi:signal transduction histidine kinase
MLRSIRWRLVLSYVLITLLTVSLVGLLTLSLIRHHVRQREMDHLSANAQTIARQALPFMQPRVERAELLELAQTASFFTNARVRILDDDRRVLADSGLGRDLDAFVWITQSGRIEYDLEAPFLPSGTFIVALPAGETLVLPGMRRGPFPPQEGLPPGLDYTIVRRVEGPWGSRITFGTVPQHERHASRIVAKNLFQEPHLVEDTPRSQETVEVAIGPTARPLGYVELSGSPDFGAETLKATGRALLFAAGGTALLALILGLLVSRGLTAPLRDLTAAASQMSGEDLSARAPIRGRGEISQLARQFNQMADRLEASFAELAAERDSLRRFIVDASHELRTPITALKTFNELLQGPAADEPSARSEFLDESQNQLKRLEWITHNLLDLSRLESGLIHLDLAEHSVVNLIQTAAGAFRNLAQEKDITLSTKEPPPEITLRCDRARIESALYNLLDNGLKYTPSGGQVEIGAEEAGEILRFWVRDDGPGIEPSDLPLVFERFYQGQTSDAEGSGLGLAIVHSVAQAHGGRARVESKPGEGSYFTVELPLAATISPSSG